MKNNRLNAQNVCENILRDEIKYNIDNKILKGSVIVGERLLERGVELSDAYLEVYNKLHQTPYAIKAFFESITSSLRIWSSEEIAEERNNLKRLEEINKKIASISNDLANLLDERSVINNNSAIRSNTYCHICDAINAAGNRVSLYKLYVQEEVKHLCREFPLKYWPSMSDILRVISLDASQAEIIIDDPVTEVALQSQRGSNADLVRVFLADLEGFKKENMGLLPDDFKLTDKSVASFINCVLDLDDILMCEDYVKGVRNRSLKSDDCLRG